MWLQCKHLFCSLLIKNFVIFYKDKGPKPFSIDSVSLNIPQHSVLTWKCRMPLLLSWSMRKLHQSFQNSLGQEDSAKTPRKYKVITMWVTPG